MVVARVAAGQRAERAEQLLHFIRRLHIDVGLALVGGLAEIQIEREAERAREQARRHAPCHPAIQALRHPHHREAEGEIERPHERHHAPRRLVGDAGIHDQRAEPRRREVTRHPARARHQQPEGREQPHARRPFVAAHELEPVEPLLFVPSLPLHPSRQPRRKGQPQARQRLPVQQPARVEEHDERRAHRAHIPRIAPRPPLHGDPQRRGRGHRLVENDARHRQREHHEMDDVGLLRQNRAGRPERRRPQVTPLPAAPQPRQPPCEQD